MKTTLKTLGVAAAIAATSLGFVQSAEARDRWGHRGGGDDAAIAIGAGVIGLAVGAALADRDDGRYYDSRYYRARRYVTIRDYPGYYYYYDGAPRRYYRDRYYGQPYYGNRWGNGWGRGYDRRDWRGGRGYYRDHDRRWGRVDWDRRDDYRGRRWGY